MNSERDSSGSIRAVGDRAPGDDRQPVERRALRRDDRRALALPVRLVVGALDQVLGERLDPARVDPRGDPPPQPRRLDELGDHHPASACFRASAEPGKIAKRAPRAPWYSRRAGSLSPSVGEQAREQRGVDRRLAAPASAPVERRRRPPWPPGAAGRRGPATRARAGGAGTRRGSACGTGCPTARAAARACSATGSGTRGSRSARRRSGRGAGRPARASRPGARAGPGSTAPRRSRSPPPRSRAGRPRGPSGRAAGRPGSCASRRPSGVSRSRSSSAASSCSRRIAVADLAPVGRVEEREVLDVAEPRRRHLEDHAGEVRAQDLRVGEARALLEVLLVVEPDADARRRRGRSGPCAGRPTPARPARSAAAGPSAARCSG